MNSAFMQNLAEAAAKTAATATGRGRADRPAVSPDSGARSDGGRDESALAYLEKGTLQRYAQVLLSTNEEIFLP